MYDVLDPKYLLLAALMCQWCSWIFVKHIISGFYALRTEKMYCNGGNVIRKILLFVLGYAKLQTWTFSEPIFPTKEFTDKK